MPHLAHILRFTVSAALAAGAAAAQSADEGRTSSEKTMTITGDDNVSLKATPLETFDGAWAMTFLPDGRALVTEKDGDLWLLATDGSKLSKIENPPAVRPRGQGGLGDIIIHPDFEETGEVFISYVERDENDDTLSGAAVERAKLTLTAEGGALSDREVIWRQSPKVEGNGHYGHRLAVSPDGKLFITSGERQKFSPAQNMAMNLGKIIRIGADGAPLEDNPFYGNGDVADQVWTLGHRNPLGIAFDGHGRLWVHEMGPEGGDELNLIVRSENYGYPQVSEGEHYSGEDIPAHETNPAFENPAHAWAPAISPAGLVIYDGDMFPDWKGDAFIGGLSSKALIRVSFSEAPTDNLGQAPRDGQTETIAKEAARYAWNKRVREVEQGPDGALYVLEDRAGGRLLRLEPADE